MESSKELIDQLNITDECTTIEAKRGSAIDRSIMETVCAFSNEPGLGGGYILLGVELELQSLFPAYTVTGIEFPDKLQLDIATQSSSIFNQPVRPDIEVEKMAGGKLVMKIFIHELPDGQKPLYFKNEGLPRGAFRRIGSSDQRCTDDDLFIFYNKEDTFDSSPVKDTSIEDVSDEALSLYRSLRGKVNPYAEELNYSDEELLQSLGCIKKDKQELMLTYTGLLVFGKRQALRRLLPMVRVDYIRVPGNEWVADPENRFTTIDMRGPLIELVQRTFSAIADDLPKGFLLPEGQLQAESIGLPAKVLREAIVNAFMHRTYRENQPIQIIRYGNRIEIKNPGFSLKPEEQLGEPGSKNRNPFIAAIFHETNLAETKGSGIRTMRLLMEKAAMVPPTFESDHGANQFSTRLLLHHFLNEEDIVWLQEFKSYDLNDPQKRALIFVREAGAIDNATYRQINGVDLMKASVELRVLRDADIIEQKGKGRYTYYITNNSCKSWFIYATDLAGNQINTFSAPVDDLSAPVDDLSAPVNQDLVHQLPLNLQEIVKNLPVRIIDATVLQDVVLQLCTYKEFKSAELAGILGRSEKYLLRNFITPLREAGMLEYTFPDMANHPQQAYRTVA
ncbi:ATP-binding protein [uncultured Cytophaga sp.]|uniref:ATP-binding protein n=1 Tax=uncultured Cytophaga sp. TaxID=160238 RepID=UPI002633823A|nr:ATP-binding protein [uncultured Cytophaga sp.]